MSATTTLTQSTRLVLRLQLQEEQVRQLPQGELRVQQPSREEQQVRALIARRVTRTNQRTQELTVATETLERFRQELRASTAAAHQATAALTLDLQERESAHRVRMAATIASIQELRAATLGTTQLQREFVQQGRERAEEARIFYVEQVSHLKLQLQELESQLQEEDSPSLLAEIEATKTAIAESTRRKQEFIERAKSAQETEIASLQMSVDLAHREIREGEAFQARLESDERAHLEEMQRAMARIREIHQETTASARQEVRFAQMATAATEDERALHQRQADHSETQVTTLVAEIGALNLKLAGRG